MKFQIGDRVCHKYDDKMLGKVTGVSDTFIFVTWPTGIFPTAESASNLMYPKSPNNILKEIL